MGNIGGQSSGDFLLTQGALRILYSVFKDTIPVLAADGYTQANPNVVTATPAARSTTLPANVKRGVLGGSVAFIRPELTSNTDGGAVLVAAAYVRDTRPLGLFINDALGNSYENTPAVASGKCPHLRGGACGVKIYETAQQTTQGGGAVGDALTTYAAGQFLYASVNGYLTNRWQDSYEAQWITTLTLGSGAAGVCAEPDVTRMGIILSPPSTATGTEMFVELKM
jgi:hypothetical protein